MGQGLVDLKSLEVFVLDEADRMLDMGFIHDVRKVIVKLPRDRQTLFFSATMPREAQELADNLLKNPETVAVAPVSSTAERVDQEIYFVEKNDKRALLVDVLRETAMKRVLVFSRTKHGANRIAEHLEKAGVGAEAIHGNKSQGARERALANFKSGKIRVLVATDIAARGIDIDEVTHVVNFDVPEVPETYVHRIGRTARAGNSGMAMTFCDEEERPDLRAIERLTRLPIPVVDGHPYQSRIPAPSIFNERDPGRDPPRRPGNRGQRDASEGREHQRPGRRDMPRHGHDQRPRHDAARPAAPRTDGPRPAATGGGAPAVTGTPGGGPSGGRRRRRGGGGGGGYGGGSGGGGGGGGGGYGGGGGGGYGGR
jgi:ATP-dependent RNA helicase RhlE